MSVAEIDGREELHGQRSPAAVAGAGGVAGPDEVAEDGQAHRTRLLGVELGAPQGPRSTAAVTGPP